MRSEEFRRLVLQALDEVPPQFREALRNIDIQIRRRSSLRERSGAGVSRGTLFGLYTGVPLTKRTHYDSLTLPDTILIFQEPHERYCRSEAEIVEQVKKTLLHEIGHYLGIDEDRLHELGVG